MPKKKKYILEDTLLFLPRLLFVILMWIIFMVPLLTSLLGADSGFLYELLEESYLFLFPIHW